MTYHETIEKRNCDQHSLLKRALISNHTIYGCPLISNFQEYATNFIRTAVIWTTDYHGTVHGTPGKHFSHFIEGKAVKDFDREFGHMEEKTLGLEKFESWRKLAI